jgi:hypothetical protein
MTALCQETKTITLSSDVNSHKKTTITVVANISLAPAIPACNRRSDAI